MNVVDLTTGSLGWGNKKPAEAGLDGVRDETSPSRVVSFVSFISPVLYSEEFAAYPRVPK